MNNNIDLVNAIKLVQANIEDHVVWFITIAFTDVSFIPEPFHFDSLVKGIAERVRTRINSRRLDKKFSNDQLFEPTLILWFEDSGFSENRNRSRPDHLHGVLMYPKDADTRFRNRCVQKHSEEQIDDNERKYVELKKCVSHPGQPKDRLLSQYINIRECRLVAIEEDPRKSLNDQVRDCMDYSTKEKKRSRDYNPLADYFVS